MVLARLVLAVVMLQLGGVVGVVADLVFAGATADDATECPNEKPGHDCPPGCPTCHCAHGGVAVPPSTDNASWLADLGGSSVAAVCPYVADLPKDPPMPSVFRPPRSIALI